MQTTHLAIRIPILIAALLYLLAGCGRAADRSATSAQTQPIAPTALPSATPIPSPTPWPTETPIAAPMPGVLTVDARVGIGSISPLIFGSGYGPWVSLRPETLPLAYDAGVTILRYPGGAWGDKNDLQPYQIDQFVQLARAMGAEPYVHVRFPGGAPDRAAELVRYANEQKGYAIRYWAIGNEPSLYEAEGLEWDAESYSRAWRDFYAAMKAVDPDILIMGPEIHQYTGAPDVDPVDSQGNDWLRTFLRINGDLVDMVSVHRYPFPNNAARTPASTDELRANASEWNDIVRRLRQTVRDETGRDLPIAVTEVNSHWSRAIGGEATPDSLYSALWWGDVLGRLIQERVDLVTHFLLVSGNDSGFGMVGRNEARPTYYVYQMYKLFGHELLHTASGVDHVGVYAARRTDGAVTVMVTNLATDELAAPLKLSGVEGGVAQVWRFDAEHSAERVEDQEIGDGKELTLPGQSMTLYVLGQ